MATSNLRVLKRERERHKAHTDREAARRDVFERIETFYNAGRRHGCNNSPSPVD